MSPSFAGDLKGGARGCQDSDTVPPSSNPCCAEAFHASEVRIVGDDASSKLHRRCGDETVCDGYLSMATTDPSPRESDLGGQFLNAESAYDERLALFRRLPQSRVAAHLIEELSQDQRGKHPVARPPKVS